LSELLTVSEIADILHVGDTLVHRRAMRRWYCRMSMLVKRIASRAKLSIRFLGRKRLLPMF